VSTLAIILEEHKREFLPGEELRGKVSWNGSVSPRTATLSLLWRTSGKGSEDFEIHDQVQFQDLSPNSERPFAFKLPLSPYSFSGTLITLQWLLELVLEDPRESAILEIVVSPTRHEIILCAPVSK